MGCAAALSEIGHRPVRTGAKVRAYRRVGRLVAPTGRRHKGHAPLAEPMFTRSGHRAQWPSGRRCWAPTWRAACTQWLGGGHPHPNRCGGQCPMAVQAQGRHAGHLDAAALGGLDHFEGFEAGQGPHRSPKRMCRSKKQERPGRNRHPRRRLRVGGPLMPLKRLRRHHPVARQGQASASWLGLEKALESGDFVTGTPSGKVKGGLTVRVNQTLLSAWQPGTKRCLAHQQAIPFHAAGAAGARGAGLRATCRPVAWSSRSTATASVHACLLRPTRTGIDPGTLPTARKPIAMFTDLHQARWATRVLPRV